MNVAKFFCLLHDQHQKVTKLKIKKKVKDFKCEFCSVSHNQKTKDQNLKMILKILAPQKD